MAIKADLITILKRLGLNLYESKTYLALLTSGASTASEISSAANIPRPRVYDVLGNLETKGFVVQSPGRPVVYKSVPPSEAMSFLRTQSRDEYNTKLKEIDELQKKFETSLKGVAVSDNLEAADIVWAIKGRSNLYTRLSSLIQTANKSLSILTTKEGLVRKVKTHEPDLKSAYRQGVNVKILADVGKDNQAYAKRLSDICEIKSLENNLSRFMLFDNKEAVFVLTPEDYPKNEEISLWVRSEHFGKTLSELFDKKWSAAKPL